MLVNTEVTFETLDEVALTRVPQLKLEGYVSLIKALAGAAFEDPSLDRPKKRLDGLLVEAKGGLVGQLGDEVDVVLERKFDHFVGRVWGVIRSDLEFWALYYHEGIALFSEDERAKIELEQNREHAEVAGDLADRMFGAQGADFLRQAYPEQSAAMRSRLELIEDKGLGELFVTLVGPRLATLVQVCQQRYEAMVAERATRKSGSIANRKLLNSRIRRALRLYANAVVGTLDESNPKSAQLIELALRPLVLAGVPKKTSSSGTEVSEAAVEVEEPSESGEEESDD